MEWRGGMNKMIKEKEMKRAYGEENKVTPLGAEGLQDE